VFGELFWRPYVHVRDAARAIRHVLETPVERVRGRVYNVGRSDENYRKLDLVEVIVGRLGRGDVRYVHRAEDPRDYRVSFERIRDELGFVPTTRVPDGVDEVVAALESRRFGDPFSSRYGNVA
jgi:nucleoside-diphosphate-sugar epimerase